MDPATTATRSLRSPLRRYPYDAAFREATDPWIVSREVFIFRLVHTTQDARVGAAP